MFVHYRTKAIVLKKVDRREADQLFTLYTEDFGKTEVLARAIRKISSKLKVGMELFYLSEIEFIQGKAYKTLTDAIVIEKFINLRKDLEKATIASQISESTNSLIKDQEREGRIWQLLLNTFQILNDIKAKFEIKELIFHYFFWNLISMLGYKPELYNCPFCQEKLKPKKLYFSKKDGGVICQKCFLKDKEAKKINPEIVKILRVIYGKNINFLLKLNIKKEQTEKLNILSREYL